jgi:hypothetical protein
MVRGKREDGDTYISKEDIAGNYDKKKARRLI